MKEFDFTHVMKVTYDFQGRAYLYEFTHPIILGSSKGLIHQLERHPNVRRARVDTHYRTHVQINQEDDFETHLFVVRAIAYAVGLSERTIGEIGINFFPSDEYESLKTFRKRGKAVQGR